VNSPIIDNYLSTMVFRCSHLMKVVTLFSLLIGCLGCSQQPRQPPSTSPSPEKSHTHQAPHGGTLLRLGNEYAHLELVLDSSQGQLTLYVLDGEAENAVRLGGPIKLLVETEKDQKTELVLSPVADELTGETVDDTSRFAGRSEVLVGVTEFVGKFESIPVKGRDFSNVEFAFPEGNEGAEDHHHHEHDEDHP
jgi:hypothetical protein